MTNNDPATCEIDLDKCVVFIKAEILKAEQDVKFRDQARKTWRSGTNASWREVGCFDSKEKRLKISDSHARIAIKCRQRLEMLQAILVRLEATKPAMNAVTKPRCNCDPRSDWKGGRCPVHGE